MTKLFFALAAIFMSASTALAFNDCGDSDHYRSSDGACVHVPYRKDMTIPNETATCRDGTHSVSHHRQGTCSHHGGVERWG